MFDRVAARIGKKLKEQGIPYMIMGGQAVLQYGEPRLTKDIDITLGINVEEFRRFSGFLSLAKLNSLVRSPESFVKKTHVFPGVDPATGIRIDFIFSDSVYEKGAIRRSRSVRVRGYPLRFASVEDIIIQKLVAGRPRDTEDIARILLRRHRLDVRYIHKWIRQFEKVLDMPLMDAFLHLRNRAKSNSHITKF